MPSLSHRRCFSGFALFVLVIFVSPIYPCCYLWYCGIASMSYNLSFALLDTLLSQLLVQYKVLLLPSLQILVPRTSRGRSPLTSSGRPLKILFDHPADVLNWRPGDVSKWRPRQVDLGRPLDVLWTSSRRPWKYVLGAM